MCNTKGYPAPIYAPTQSTSIAATRCIRLLIVDDEYSYRRILRAALQIHPDIKIIGEAGDGLQAVEMANRLAPDVILMDIQMPIMDGIQATRHIVIDKPRIGIIILTAYYATEHILQAIQAGAAAHMGKNINPELLPHMIRAVSRGEAMIDSQVTSLLLNEFRNLKSLEIGLQTC